MILRVYFTISVFDFNSSWKKIDITFHVLLLKYFDRLGLTVQIPKRLYSSYLQIHSEFRIVYRSIMFALIFVHVEKII